jgi:NAD+ synthase
MQRKSRDVGKTKVNAGTNNNMTPRNRIKHIQTWIKKYAKVNRIETLVVGISGGIDSAVVSALCANTGLPTYVLSMPIKQSRATHSLSQAHGKWLTDRYSNVTFETIDLTPTFKQFEKCFGRNALAEANSRSRLRMMTLYHAAQETHGIVVGTGNRVEDFGVGFFTKYGDGGVDISPIGDCLKTQVWEMGQELEILPEIVSAAPTDGLWDDGRTDESQLGMTYPELEHAMALHNDHCVYDPLALTKTEKAQLKKFREIRSRNMHKMIPIPVCIIERNK